MVGKIEQEIKDSLKRMGKNMADLSRAAAIDHSVLSRHINGNYTMNQEKCKRVDEVMTAWEKEYSDKVKA